MNQQSLIEVNPNKMSGTPVFRDTRVPIQNLFDCIEEGETIDQFLDQFPTVSRLTTRLTSPALSGWVSQTS